MPVNHYSLFYPESGETIVHLDDPIDPGDHTLCGHDLIGDKGLGWEQGTLTIKPVNCEDCHKIAIVIKTVKTKDFSRILVKLQ